MADFVSVRLSTGTVYINLDYVLKIEVGLSEGEPTVLRLTNGEVLKVLHSDGMGVLEQLNRSKVLRQPV
jgi:hypothetical protein